MGSSVPTSLTRDKHPILLPRLEGFEAYISLGVSRWLAKVPPLAFCTILLGCVCASIAVPTIPLANYPFVFLEAGTKITNKCITIRSIRWQPLIGRPQWGGRSTGQFFFIVRSSRGNYTDGGYYKLMMERSQQIRGTLSSEYLSDSVPRVVVGIVRRVIASPSPSTDNP